MIFDVESMNNINLIKLNWSAIDPKYFYVNGTSHIKQFECLLQKRESEWNYHQTTII